MTYSKVLSGLYYLLISSDGDINDQEKNMGKLMIKKEGINPIEFNDEIKRLENFGKDTSLQLEIIISQLKKLSVTQQIRCIAWLCQIANADGFMDKKEWFFIYRLYCKELNLELSKIMDVQRKLHDSIKDNLLVPTV
ncbi:MAG TPA: TerB family tellurite resistance protein [Cyclobacteriaceae bacterium]|nr:TerB family tellurite resistance protein [Cyclobacteriaceae bacterium]